MDAADKPLKGKRVVVTRAPAQAREMIELLEQMGAEILSLPTVSFAPPKDWSAVDHALRNISDFDWLIFTSQNAVEYFCRRCDETKIHLGELSSSKLRVAVIGTVTYQAAEKEGVRVDYVAKGQTGESLAEELRGQLNRRKVLLPHSDIASHVLPKALRDAGAIVVEAVAYRTTSPLDYDLELIDRIRADEVDVVVFSSPSAFHNFATLFQSDERLGLPARIRFATIGPTTSLALRDVGIRADIEAQEYSAGGLANAIAEYYRRQNSPARHS